MVLILYTITFTLVKNREFYEVVKVGEDKDFRHSWWLLTNNSIFAFLIFDLRVCYSLCFIYFTNCCKFCMNTCLWNSKGVWSSFYFFTFGNYCVCSYIDMFCQLSPSHENKSCLFTYFDQEKQAIQQGNLETSKA